jgi:hypothetical protein
MMFLHFISQSIFQQLNSRTDKRLKLV